MARIPGSPEEKLALLSGINDRTLPHLVGDILYFSLNHKDIRVVDGPGDGKRDIHSVLSDGTRHITQCKYHANTNASVGSGETDELVLALMKFGCTSGLFVTTGRISPQAKREYLDNYPNLKLDFLDGTNLVDAVLSSPVLSGVWFNGKSIVQTHQTLRIPFVMRRVKDDMPIEAKVFSDLNHDGIVFTFREGSVEKELLKPYRSPLDTQHSESSSTFAHGHYAYCLGSATLHDIPLFRKILATKICQDISALNLPMTIRFGIPSLVPIDEAIRENFFNDKDETLDIRQIKPVSYVIGSERTVTEERAWVLLSNTEFWKFPENLSVAESEWAGWLNQKLDTICIEQLETPTDHPPYYEAILMNLRRDWIDQSLFTLILRADYENLIASVPKEEHPHWVSDYGLGELLIGWLHPLYLYEQDHNVTIQYNKEKGRYEGFAREDIRVQEFIEMRDKLRVLLKSRGLLPITAEKAILIAKVSDDPLLNEIHYIHFGSAHLFHYFEDIPSPIYLHRRSLIFVRMWELPGDLNEVREIMVNNPVDLDSEVSAYWDAKIGPKMKNIFVMSSVKFSCPPNVSCDSFLNSIETKLDEYLNILAAHIKTIWRDAKLSTTRFWRTEVGFKIEDGKFEGNPWVVFAEKAPSKE